MVLALSQVLQAYNMRSEHSLFKIGVFSNRSLNQAALVCIGLMALVLFTPLATVFGLIRLPGYVYLVGLCLILVPTVIMKVAKALGLIKKHQRR